MNIKKIQLRIHPHIPLDVIGWMRVKFVAAAMGILILVLLIMLGSINLIMQTVSQSQSGRLLAQIAESERYNTLEPFDRFEFDRMQDIEVMMTDTGSRSVSQGASAWGEFDRRWEHENPEMPTRAFIPDPPPRDEGWREPSTWGEEHFWENPPPEMTEPQIPATEKPEERPTEPPATPVPEPTDTAALPVTEAAVQAATQTLPPTETATETEPTNPTTNPATDEAERETFPKEAAPRMDEPMPREPRPDKWNLTITLDHFAIMVDMDGNFLDLRNTENYTREEAEEIMNGILSRNESSGMYGWLQYCRVEKEYGTLIVITDKTSDQGLLNQLFRTTVILGLLVLLLLFVFLCFCSGWITKPVKSAFIRQKQFVSDAGHELKTPLTILSANADLLQDEIGENKWLMYMQEQTSRMNQLVGDLLRLARMDNASQAYAFETFNLSTAVSATVLPFEGQAFELHRNLELDIQPGLEYHGSEQHIRQLTAIFVDNAMKYSNENGTIKVTLLKRGEHCVLEFFNTGCEISQKETEKIFERFYRGDKARGNSGKSGYGLGLAIAKGIMEIHRIRIQVTCEQGGWIRFLLIL